MRDPSAVSKRKKVWIIAVGVPLGLLVAFFAAWGIDTYMHKGDVARNVTLAGVDVSGKTDEQLQAAVISLSQKLPETKVHIETGEFAVDTTAGALGLSIDPERTMAQAKAVRRDDPWIARPFTWVGSWFSAQDADVRLDVDDQQLDTAVKTLEGDRRIAPTEPTIEVDESGVKLVPGKDGKELTTVSVLEAMPNALADLADTIDAEVTRTVMKPTIADATVQALVDQANKVTEGKITLVAGEESFDVEGTAFRTAFALAPADPNTPNSAPTLAMNGDVVSKILAKNQPAGGGNPTDVKFDLQGGNMVPVAGHDAQVCCGPEAPQKITAALLAGNNKVDLPTRTMTAAEGVTWANTLGVNQVVGEFTTRHPAGQPRVKNIHTISDTTRGVLIAPGDTFSVNGYVGRRTTEKGYVVAPVIENGEYTDDVGGGVSQYATTLFNAAFFGGLRHTGVQGALEVHQPVPVRPRGDARLPRRRPQGAQQHAVRGRGLADVHGFVGHRAALVDAVRTRRADRPEPERRVREGHDAADAGRSSTATPTPRTTPPTTTASSRGFAPRPVTQDARSGVRLASQNGSRR